MPNHAHRTRDAKPRRTDRRLAHHVAQARERELAAASPAPAVGRTYAYTRVSTDMQSEHGQSLHVQRGQN
jgi:hypothetical protein